MTEQSEEKPRRHSGMFAGIGLTPEWNGHEDLAKLCGEADLTNHQAKAVLLYCVYEKSASEIGEILEIHRKSAWRLLHQAGRKVIRRWPEFGEAIDAWNQLHKDEAVSVLSAFRNSFGSSRTPQYMQNSPGEYRIVGAPRLVEWTDIIKHDAPLSALEMLLRTSKGECYA